MTEPLEPTEFTASKALKTAWLAGGSGLVGREVIWKLAATEQFTPTVALVRKPLRYYAQATQEVRASFADLATESLAWPTPHIALCCLGTTLAQAGSKAAFRAIDFDAVLAFARAAKARGAAHFGVISALGADPKSSVFYSRTKGEIEQALRELAFPSLCILQPSFLLGFRSEPRLGERLGIAIAQCARPLLQGPLRQYRAVPAEQVAEAMVQQALVSAPGVSVLRSAAIAEFRRPPAHNAAPLSPR